jgi:hypothetical protein
MGRDYYRYDPSVSGIKKDDRSKGVKITSEGHQVYNSHPTLTTNSYCPKTLCIFQSSIPNKVEITEIYNHVEIKHQFKENCPIRNFLIDRGFVNFQIDREVTVQAILGTLETIQNDYIRDQDYNLLPNIVTHRQAICKLFNTFDLSVASLLPKITSSLLPIRIIRRFRCTKTFDPPANWRANVVRRP